MTGADLAQMVWAQLTYLPPAEIPPGWQPEPPPEVPEHGSCVLGEEDP